MYNIEEIKSAKPTDEFVFTCKHCGKNFAKTKKYISKCKYKLPVFCCVECQKEWYEKNSYIEVECKKCGKRLRILKGDYNKNETKNFFCSHSCSASYNNSNRIRKKIEKAHENSKCPICGKAKYYTSELCQECRNKEKRKIKERTLGSFIEGHKYLTTKCSLIRKDARRTIVESGKERVCEYCHNHEYDDILEVHHIKSILEFENDSTVAEINDINNLVWLCPNHHKMLEMGLIKLNRKENLIDD